MKVLVRYVTKCDNVTRYYEAENLEKAKQAAKELAKYKNLFHKINVIL